jgi:acyl-CoA thioesterase FadM
MRWTRLLLALLTAKFRKPVPVTGTSELSFRVWITDIDVSIMNHAALLTVMEMGRIDFMVRTGFFKLASKRKWYFMSSSVSASFLRPLKAFQLALLTTRILHMDDQWIYIEQKINRKGKDMAYCIVKSKVKNGRDTVATTEILEGLGMDPFPLDAGSIISNHEAEVKMMADSWNARH